jgi:hypothetical protein
MDPVTQFEALALPAGNGVGLSWANPPDADFVGMRVLRKTSAYPEGPEDPDAELIYEGEDTRCRDYGELKNDTSYHYAAYAFDDQKPRNYTAPALIVGEPAYALTTDALSLKEELYHIISEGLGNLGVDGVTVRKGFAIRPADLPAVIIMRIGEPEEQQYAGMIEGEYHDQVEGEYVNWEATERRETVSVLVISGKSSDQRDELFQQVDSILFAARDRLLYQGFKNINRQGGADEDGYIEAYDLWLYMTPIMVSGVSPIRHSFRTDEIGSVSINKVRIVGRSTAQQGRLEIGLNLDVNGWNTYGTTFFDHWKNECNVNALEYSALRWIVCPDTGFTMDDVAAVVNQAVEYGFDVVLRVGGWTHWERDHPDFHPWDDTWTPSVGGNGGWNVLALESTEEALAKMPGVRKIQIDNEPQIEIFGTYAASFPFDAQHWTKVHELWKRQYAAVKAANPDNQVISPGWCDGMQITLPQTRQGIASLEYYLRLLDLARQVPPWDILGCHFWSTSWHLEFYRRWRHAYRGIGHILKTYDSLLRERGLIMPIWITEGARSIIRTNGGFQDARTPADQRKFFVDAIAECRDIGLDITFLWFCWKNTYEDGNYALIFNDTGPNPVYYTWKAYCKAFNRRES